MARLVRVGWMRRANGGRSEWLEVDAATQARFVSYIDLRGPDECWPWLRSRRRSGYGQFRLGGAAGTVVEASRVAYALAHGECAPMLVVRHSCDNPPCCNPYHLLGGTHADNYADALARGRIVHVTTYVEAPCVICGAVSVFAAGKQRATCGGGCLVEWHRQHGDSLRGADGKFAVAA